MQQKQHKTNSDGAALAEAGGTKLPLVLLFAVSKAADSPTETTSALWDWQWLLNLSSPPEFRWKLSSIRHSLHDTKSLPFQVVTWKHIFSGPLQHQISDYAIKFVFPARLWVICSNSQESWVFKGIPLPHFKNNYITAVKCAWISNHPCWKQTKLKFREDKEQIKIIIYNV